MRLQFLCGILSPRREAVMENGGEGRAGSFITSPPAPLSLWLSGLWPIRPISNNKTREDTTKPGRQAGRQAVS